MNCYQIIFSPTGGTERAAAAITRNWPEVRTIDLSDPHTDFSGVSFDPDSLVLVAMPSFGGVAPQLALDRLAQMQGNGARCALAAVYGNRAYEDTLLQMSDFAKQAGFSVLAAVSAVAEHSIIREYAAGRPNADDCAELAGFGDRILEKVRSGDLSEPALPGKRPYKTSSAGMFPKTNSHCTACGLCAQKCPAGAIHPDDLRTTDTAKCISCMRCVSLCPAHARTLNPLMVPVVAAALKKACSVPKANELFLS